MITNSLSRRLFALPIAFAAMTANFDLLAAPKGPSGNKQDIPVNFTLYDVHTDVDGVPTGAVTGLESDGSVYSDSNSVDTNVGRNRNIWLSVSTGRSVTLDLTQGLGCANSVNVDLVTEEIVGGVITVAANQPDGVCDHCYEEALPAGLTEGRLTVSDFTLSIQGEDLDDLDAGGDCVSETIAQLRFKDSTGREWRLVWGPRRQAPGKTLNPRSHPVKLRRTNSAVVDGETVAGNYWWFQTSGDHLAALYRRESPQAENIQQYFGQFSIPFSGFAVAQAYDPALTGEHCDLNMANIDHTLEPAEVTLEQSGTLLTATATELCEDFSGCPDCFDWYVDGVPVSLQSGNSFDLSLYPGACLVEVVAVHPDWPAILPSLSQITRADVEGNTFYDTGFCVDRVTISGVDWSFPRGGKDLNVVITLKDANADPVSNARVEGTLTGPAGSGTPISFDDVTDGSGTISVRLNNVPDGTYCVTISSITHSTLEWDGQQPEDACANKN